MTRGTFLMGAVATALAVTVTPAMAQRSAGGAESTGTAVSRGGGGGDSGGAVSRGSSGGDSGSGSSSSGSSSGGGSNTSSAPSSSPRSNEFMQAPTRPSERQGRSRSDAAARSGGGDRAVSRGSTGEAATSSATSRTGSATSGSELSSDPSRRAVPAYSRPRDGRPVTGEAVGRTFPPYPGGGGSSYVRYPYPYYGQYYWPGLYGIGFYYDPLWYDPFYYGTGVGLGYGGYGGGYGGGGGYYGGNPYGSSGSGSYSSAGTGSLRLKIKPRDAEVYIDGYYVGTVDQFDGVFQKLKVDAGSRRIEIRSEGRESSHIDVVIAPGETITYEGELKAIK